MGNGRPHVGPLSGKAGSRAGMDHTLRGVLPAIVTPMTPDASDLDYAALARLSLRLVAAGVGGIVPCGSTGEFATLSNAERRRVTEVVLEAVGERVPIVPHTGALSTSETIELSVHAETSGAAGVMVVPPFYEPLNWRELVRHYQAIREAITIPIVYYNIPSVSGIRLSPSQLVELAQLAEIQYIKDTTGNAVALTELVERYGGTVTTFNGWDSMTLLGFAAGTRGSIWGAANFVPELCVALFESIHDRGDLLSGREIWSRLWPICEFLETHNYAAAVKAGCELIGQPVGPPRRPFLPLENDERVQLAGLLERARIAQPAAT